MIWLCLWFGPDATRVLMWAVLVTVWKLFLNWLKKLHRGLCRSPRILSSLKACEASVFCYVLRLDSTGSEWILKADMSLCVKEMNHNLSDSASFGSLWRQSCAPFACLCWYLKSLVHLHDQIHLCAQLFYGASQSRSCLAEFETLILFVQGHEISIWHYFWDNIFFLSGH